MDRDNTPDIDKKILRSLVNKFPNESPYRSDVKYQDHLFDQYKLYVEMAEQISSKRQTASSFFLSINTALIGLLAYFNISDSFQSDNFFHAIIAVVGIALNYLWYRLIRSYGDLNTAKFKVIHEIERFLPLNLFNAEWEAVGRGKNPKLYLPFTRIEKRIPRVLKVLYF